MRRSNSRRRWSRSSSVVSRCVVPSNASITQDMSSRPSRTVMVGLPGEGMVMAYSSLEKSWTVQPGFASAQACKRELVTWPPPPSRRCAQPTAACRHAVNAQQPQPQRCRNRQHTQPIRQEIRGTASVSGQGCGRGVSRSSQPCMSSLLAGPLHIRRHLVCMFADRHTPEPGARSSLYVRATPGHGPALPGHDPRSPAHALPCTGQAGVTCLFNRFHPSHSKRFWLPVAARLPAQAKKGTPLPVFSAFCHRRRHPPHGGKRATRCCVGHLIARTIFGLCRAFLSR